MENIMKDISTQLLDDKLKETLKNQKKAINALSQADEALGNIGNIVKPIEVMPTEVYVNLDD